MLDITKFASLYLKCNLGKRRRFIMYSTSKKYLYLCALILLSAGLALGQEDFTRCCNNPVPEFVTLEIFSTSGEKIQTLISEKLLPGKYKYTWQAGHLASGVYIARLKAGTFIQSRKLILIK